MTNYWKVVRKVLRKSNVVLEILDARFPRETRNKDLENSCKKADKKLVIVLNKADLVSKEKGFQLLKEFSKDFPAVLVSTRLRQGKKRLFGILKGYAKRKDLFVSVLGYPNTGKSSVINYLKGKKSARTSIQAGLTRGKQYLRISPKIMLVDTPGVIPFYSYGESKLAVLAAKSPQDLKDKPKTAQKILKRLKQNGAQELWGVKLEGEDFEEMLEKIAVEKKRLKQGGKPDTEAIARRIILEWQKGKISLPQNA